MGVELTLGVLAAAVAATGFFGWMGARPRNLMAPPSLIPYRILMLFSFALAVSLATYLVAQFKQT
jgi:hypothetical protein